MTAPWLKYQKRPTAPSDPLANAPRTDDPYSVRHPEKPPTPLQVDAAARDEERIRIARENADRGERTDARAERSDARAQAAFDGTGGAGTEAEKKIATLLTRIAGGFQDIQNITKESPDAARPGFIEGLRGDLSPGGVGGMVVRGIAGSERRSVNDAQRDMLDAILTMGTGAAYAPEQLQAEMAAHFPQYGDSPDEAAVKNQRLARLIEAAKANAGPAWAKIEPQIAPLMRELGAGSESEEEEGLGAGTKITYEGPASIARGLAEGAGDAIEGAAAIPGMIINPLGQMLYNATGYGEHTYDLGDILRGAVGAPESAPGIGRSMRQGSIAALTGAGIARAGTQIASGVAGKVLNTVGRTPVRDAAAGAGAGAGSEIGGELGGVPGAVAGTLLGGVGGYAGANRLARFGQGQPTALASAARDLDISLTPADAGGTGTRMASGMMGRTLGGIPIADGSRRSLASAGQATRNVANRVGTVTDEAGAGQAVRRGAKDFAENSSVREGELFGKVSVPADAPVQLNSTKDALFNVTSRFQSNPALAEVWGKNPRMKATLEALVPKVTRDAKGNIVKGQMEGGNLSWQDMKGLRSMVGEIIGRPGVKSDGSDIADMRRLYAALTADMESTAAASGPKALQEWRRAVDYSRGRHKRMDDVFATLFGNKDQKSDEAVFRQLQRWGKEDGGDFNRLARAVRSLPKDEADTVRATLIQRMGLATKANQSSTEEVFSAKQWAGNWNGISPRAKSVLFPDKTHRTALDKLALVLDNMKQADQFQNYSNTAAGANAIALTGIGTVASPVAAAFAAAAQYAGGMLLASPAVARALARTAKLPPEAQGRTLDKQLVIIAQSKPTLAAEINALRTAINDNAQLGSAVASEDRDRQ